MLLLTRVEGAAPFFLVALLPGIGPIDHDKGIEPDLKAAAAFP